jgi:uncharacterized protein (TIGR03435 family)
MYHQSSELPAYRLIISEGGPKFRESDPATPHNIAAAKGRLIVQKVSMPNIARVLTLSLDRLVLDRTGLSGRYTFRLEWDPEPSTTFDFRALSSAMQMQLGLRLEMQ